MLDVDHGTYPYVTSSSTSIGNFMNFQIIYVITGGVPTGTGIAPTKIETVIGIVKVT